MTFVSSRLRTSYVSDSPDADDDLCVFQSFKLNVDGHSALKESVMEEGKALLLVITSHQSGTFSLSPTHTHTSGYTLEHTHRWPYRSHNSVPFIINIWINRATFRGENSYECSPERETERDKDKETRRREGEIEEEKKKKRGRKKSRRAGSD